MYADAYFFIYLTMEKCKLDKIMDVNDSFIRDSEIYELNHLSYQ